MKGSSPPSHPTGLIYRVDGESLNTLIEKYEKSLSTNITEQDRVDKLKQEYTNLKTRLTTLPLHLEYNALVPLGRRALCPGKIVHTNEIMCLLGDNWFVECSATKAIEIVNHRIAKLDEQHEGLRKERELINNWKQEAERQLVETIGEGTVEIREDYDEDHENQWRDLHRENVRRYHQQLAKERLEAKQEKHQTYDELWSRLDELELQEELEEYWEQQGYTEEHVLKSDKSLSKEPSEATRTAKTETKQQASISGTESSSNISPEEKTEVTVVAPRNPPSVPKRVKFSADNIIHDISDDITYDNQDSFIQEKSTNHALSFTDDDTISSYPCFDPIMIRFRHSVVSNINEDENNTSGTEEDDQISQIVSSPGQIVKVFGPTSISAISNKPLPKSILKPFAPPLVDHRSKKAQVKVPTKKKVATAEDDENDDIDIDSVDVNPAMSTIVTERVPVFTTLQLKTPTTINLDESESNVDDKPVSLFKMRRQQQAASLTATSPD